MKLIDQSLAILQAIAADGEQALLMAQSNEFDLHLFAFKISSDKSAAIFQGHKLLNSLESRQINQSEFNKSFMGRCL